MSALILIVEDEPHLADVLEAYAKQKGFRSERAADGNAALSLFRSARPDLELLDIMLPGKSGLDVLRSIREGSATPVILVTARAEESDHIVGLELGTDDYVVKPFRPREVMARVRAVVRRAHAALESGQDTPLRVGPLDIDRRAVSVSGQDLSLTPTEYRLLSHLAAVPYWAFNCWKLPCPTVTPWNGWAPTWPEPAVNWKPPGPPGCCIPCAAWATGSRRAEPDELSLTS